ncbi:MAG: cobalamin B12-binding domain-containing protein [Deltaproteobacteria bacterium]|nr:cobalamin B12-binding domain-containing protein [Deltaproteobacteria bacterium]
MKRFLMVVPRWVNRPGDFYAFPLGLAYLSAALKREGHAVECLNLNHATEPVPKVIAEAVQKREIDVLCTGGLSVHYPHIKMVLDSARAARKDIATVLGGGMLSAEPQYIFENLAPTYGVVGEGELTMAELARAMCEDADVRCIQGILYRDKEGNTRVTPPRSPNRDLDSLAWPDYEGFEIRQRFEMTLPTDDYPLNMHDHPRVLEIIASRSCPFSCTFCFHPLGKVYRERSLDGLFAEIDHLVQAYRPNTLMVLDELFAVKRNRLIEFCNRIKPYGLNWLVQLRVDLVDEETLALMKDAGCTYISYGIESMSAKVLTSMKKKTDPVQVNKALRLTYEKKIGIQGNLIFGDAAETMETAVESLEWWSKNRQYQAFLTSVVPYPGTHLYFEAIRKGLIPDQQLFLEAGCPPVNTTAMDNREWNELNQIISTLNESIVLPGELKSVKRQSESHPVRGPLLTLEATCAHCRQDVVYKNIPMGQNPFGRLSLRLSCKKCHGRFDLPFSLRGKPSYPVEVGQRVARARHLVSQDKISEALPVLREVLAQYPTHEEALQILGLLALFSGSYPAAVNVLSRAVMWDPYNASLHRHLAAGLRGIGRNLIAEIHAVHADNLESLARRGRELAAGAA